MADWREVLCSVMIGTFLQPTCRDLLHKCDALSQLLPMAGKEKDATESAEGGQVKTSQYVKGSDLVINQVN